MVNNSKNDNSFLERQVANQVLKWRIAFLVACTVGLCLSIDLLRLHIAVHTDPNYHSYCAISEKVNCETVAESKYAVFLGLPLALWGIIYYLFQGSLSIWGLRKSTKPPTWPFAIAYWFSLVSTLISIILFLISHFIINSVCIICMCTYVVNLCLLTFSTIEIKRHRSGIIKSTISEVKAIINKTESFAILAFVFLTIIILLWVFLPSYWEVEASTGPGGIPVGFTLDGHPWIGAPYPKLTIIEFSDYQCPHCFRGHSEIRAIIQNYPSSFKLIHMHFPLDSNCHKELKFQLHPFACLYAKMAYCAGKQNKFWQVNDYLFVNGRRKNQVTVEELSSAFSLNATEMANCINSQEALDAIEKDISAGKQYNIRGTPTYVINNKNYPGYIPPDVLGLQSTNNN